MDKSSAGSILKKQLGKLGPLLALFILVAILSLATNGGFLKVSNLMNVFRQVPIVALMAAGMLLVLLTGGIDLSAGSLLAISTTMMGAFMKSLGVNNSILLLIICIGSGTLFGLLNGLMLTKLRLPHPFISTLGMKNVARGLALVITGSAAIQGFPKIVTFLGYQDIPLPIGGKHTGFPISFLFVLLVYFLVFVLLNKTKLGRKIYAYGGNREAARLAGINVEHILLFVYAASGFMCSLAGVVYVGRLNSAVPLASLEGDLDAIASCIIGGTSFSGGKGTIGGVLIGAFMIQIIRNGSNLLGISSDLQQIVIGAVIVIAVYVDVLRTLRVEKAKTAAAAAKMRSESQ